MKVLKEFFPFGLSISFVTSAIWFRSWPLGLCSVVCLCGLMARDAYEIYLLQKQDSSQLAKLVEEENKKIHEQLEKLSQQIGIISYRVNEVNRYVGAPAGE